MTQFLTETQRAALEAVCDTVVPSIDRPLDPDGFWARKASDLHIAAGVEELLSGIPSEEMKQGLAGLLDLLADETQGMLDPHKTQASREQVLRNIAMAGPEGA